MGRYYRLDNFRGFPNTETAARSGDSRQGVIPRVETPAEKVQRILGLGYKSSPLEHTTTPESKYASYDLGNKDLPAYKHKEEIIEAVNSNRISLLTGPTGSGKTTQFAQFALEAGYDRIVYLQPRRINVDNISERIEDELVSQLGEAEAKGLVGLAHSEHVSLDNQTPIQVMTSGTFTKKVPDLAKEWADLRVAVVADEIHENNLETEFAAAFAARQVEKNSNWRLVFASATPDSNVLGGSFKAINGGDIPTVAIEGRPHQLEMLEEPDMDIIDAYHKYNAGVAKTMIFVAGKRDINETIDKLRRSMSAEEAARTRFFKLHAKISERAKQEIFDMELAPGEKAVIVSTSAGQSGITIPGLGLVITSGLTKSPELDAENAPGLPTRHCTQSEIVQQFGRAGRDIEGGRGVLARPTGFSRAKNDDNELYDFVPLEDRYPDMPPEIYSSNIARNVLSAAAMGEDFFEFNNYLKNSVQPSSIYEAYDVLNKLGAVDDNNVVTDTGLLMDIYPLRPELSRAVAEVSLGRSLNIQVYTLLIAAATEAGGLADFDTGRNEWRKSLRPSTDDDFIAQLDMMLETRPHYRGYSVDEDALITGGFDFKNVYRAHRQFDKMCRSIGLEPRDIDLPYPTADEEDELRAIILAGMPDLVYQKVATVRGVGKYQNVWGYDSAIERELSSRSLLSKMGQTATRVVVGYPRWYLRDNGERKDIIDMAFTTSPDQLRKVIGHLGHRSLEASVRGGNLVKGGKLHLGAMPLGDMKTVAVPASSSGDTNLLSDAYLRSDLPALKALQELGLPEKEIMEQALAVAVGAHSVSDIDSRLWNLVAKLQA